MSRQASYDQIFANFVKQNSTKCSEVMLCRNRGLVSKLGCLVSEIGNINVNDEETAERERKNDILQYKLLYKLPMPHITFYCLIYHLETT